MIKKISLYAIITFTIAACKDNQVREQFQPATPKALEDKSSYEIISKRGREDLVESLYMEMVGKDVQLKKLEEEINALDAANGDSVKVFKQFDGKIRTYFGSADSHVEGITDSLLRNKIKNLLDSNLAKYNSKIAKHNELLSAISTNTAKISDLHTVLKIVKTLPLIEKYQDDNLPDIKPLNGFVKCQEKAIRLADTLIKK